jgi:hypothetical protein
MTDSKSIIRKIRCWLIIFLAGLILSGLTSFPLLTEVSTAERFLSSLGMIEANSELYSWISRIHVGLKETDSKYPFISYGTDWLGFAHIAIAIFFIGAYRDPARNIWIFQAGMICCALVPIVAFVCGSIREIPIFWRLIDSSFGVFGFIPLWFCYKYTLKLKPATVEQERSPLPESESSKTSNF